jgi:hypothetical protein
MRKEPGGQELLWVRPPGLPEHSEAGRAGRIGSIHKAKVGEGYGFVVYDEADRASLYLGFSTWHDADRAAREAQGLLVTALACVRR